MKSNTLSIEDGGRVFHNYQIPEPQPAPESYDGLSRGELTESVDDLVFEVDGVCEAIYKLREQEAHSGGLSRDESRELLLLEAEHEVLSSQLDILRWQDEHPKFVTAVHQWVEKGFSTALNRDHVGVSRLDVIRDIIVELASDDEPEELMTTVLLVENEYRAEDLREKIIRQEAGEDELSQEIGRRVLVLAA